jgi:ubiquinone/menaquinone biosynthesis C-methylase UbiE/ribosomal protein S18 acetylase RimI-like enzyme
MISIRRARIEDLPGIKAVLAATWRDTYASFLSELTIAKVTAEWHSPEIIEAEIKRPSTFAGVAETPRSGVIGMVTAHSNGDLLVVARLYVLPEFQRRGIGKRLMAESYRAFPQTRCVRLGVEELNSKARAFYRKIGFGEFGVQSDDIAGTKLSSILMEKHVEDNSSSSDIDKVFAGSIPEFYERYLVPLIFEPYAADLAARLASKPLTRVLEIAAGTGVVTRAMASALPDAVSIVATDLNQPMLDYASGLGSKRRVEWRQADAMRLPFEDATFDAVVCQFGVMFFPDKAKAYSEARRVLKPGGTFLFNVWDKIEQNEFADTVTTALQTLFPTDPPRFLARTPHGYYDKNIIERDLAKGGFTASAEITTVTARSRAQSFKSPAIAYCQGTPLRNEIEARDASRLGDATDVAAEAIGKRFGRGAVDGKIQAHIVSIRA